MIIIYPITNTLSENTKLVQEYQEDEDRTNETVEICGKKRIYYL